VWKGGVYGVCRTHNPLVPGSNPGRPTKTSLRVIALRPSRGFSTPAGPLLRRISGDLWSLARPSGGAVSHRLAAPGPPPSPACYPCRTQSEGLAAAGTPRVSLVPRRSVKRWLGGPSKLGTLPTVAGRLSASAGRGRPFSARLGEAGGLLRAEVVPARESACGSNAAGRHQPHGLKYRTPI